MAVMHKFKYPIETQEAQTFWASKHKCNRMKAVIAFSEDLADANMNLKRMGYRLFWRIKALNNFGMYVFQPDMKNVPFTEVADWWECMPYDPDPIPPTNCVWVDADTWVDTARWTEC